MIKAVVIIPSYASTTSIDKAHEALRTEIQRSLKLNYSSKLQWRDVVILDLEDDPRPYNELPVLTFGDYAYIRAKYHGYSNITRAPSPADDDFAGCSVFTRFNKKVGQKLRWGVRAEDE